jgi:hypothetical protein
MSNPADEQLEVRGEATHELPDKPMNQNQLAKQQRESDTGVAAKLQLFSSQEDAGHFPSTAPDEAARDEDAEVQPSVEALIQAVLNSNIER